eukprot:TRINITY_DN9126_c0_g1_i3.p1 TRINITY_DN9126_c0_g1~~TRINITY_DN9126_c0_g1_i3.p1  ORF type:complete len:499 (+),score=96.07 TRINITY_DN9126_c0_g1_i3:95-1591(+)
MSQQQSNIPFVIIGIVICALLAGNTLLAMSYAECAENKDLQARSHDEAEHHELTQLVDKTKEKLEESYKLLAELKAQRQQTAERSHSAFDARVAKLENWRDSRPIAAANHAPAAPDNPAAHQERQQMHKEEGEKQGDRQKNQAQRHAIDGVDAPKEIVAAVVVMACNRPSVKRCLDLLLEYRPSREQFPIVVSQDCGHEPTARAVRKYSDRGVELMQQPDLSNPRVEPGHSNFVGYYKIARHYKWALTQMFDVKGYDSVIIVEDDLDIAPDFFEYMTMGRSLLQADPTLWCVSAWNDNGKQGFVKDNAKLYRTDFFGGLGWMLRKDVWQEFRSKWPASFWDDWVRDNRQRRDRSCIRPEVSRSRTFGKVGVSKGQFFDQYLKYIQLADTSIPFASRDWHYLLKANYDPAFHKQVYEDATEITLDQALGISDTSKEYRLSYHYSRQAEFARIAKKFGIMEDWKDGVPRTAYKGIVTFVRNGARIHLAPKLPWPGYKTGE